MKVDKKANQFDQHFALLVIAQDQWKEAYKAKLEDGVKAAVFHSTGHDTCEVCCSCPICAAIEQMFDPNHPGEYQTLCPACQFVYDKMKALQGQLPGILLFSHWVAVEPGIIRRLFENPKVKKAYILDLRHDRAHDLTMEKVEELEVKVIALRDLGDDKERPNGILEVRRDEYM